MRSDTAKCGQCGRPAYHNGPCVLPNKDERLRRAEMVCREAYAVVEIFSPLEQALAAWEQCKDGAA